MSKKNSRTIPLWFAIVLVIVVSFLAAGYYQEYSNAPVCDDSLSLSGGLYWVHYDDEVCSYYFENKSLNRCYGYAHVESVKVEMVRR